MLVAFIVGVLLVAIIAVGTILAYEQSYAGKVAAGVSIGGVEVAGLTRDEAAAKLEAAFASVGTGAVTLKAETGDTTLTYAQLGRRPDVEAMLDDAFAVGRTGNPLERVVEEARTAVNRLSVAPGWPSTRQFSKRASPPWRPRSIALRSRRSRPPERTPSSTRPPSGAGTSTRRPWSPRSPRPSPHPMRRRP